MPSSRRALCLLAFFLSTTSSVPAGDQGWKSAEAGWRYVFPRDHGPHRGFKTEWWYATGNLTDEKGREYGFQLTFFREGINSGSLPKGSSRFRIKDLPFAHFALTDVNGRSFHYAQASSRGAYGEAGFGTPPGRMAWLNDWMIGQDDSGNIHLKAGNSGQAIDLTLSTDRPPLIQGKDGVSPKSTKPGHASHYYSLTRLKANGTLDVDGKSHPVSGLVWFDHEWATNQLDPGEVGWDWAGLHLSNGDDLMLFQIRDKDGNPVFSSGTLRDATGTIVMPHDLEMIPKGLWKSPNTGSLYPAGFLVRIPSRSLSLSVSPKLADQELLLSPFAYWEGSVRGEGMSGTEKITAEGYLELTGYGGKIPGLSGP